MPKSAIIVSSVDRLDSFCLDRAIGLDKKTCCGMSRYVGRLEDVTRQIGMVISGAFENVHVEIAETDPLVILW